MAKLIMKTESISLIYLTLRHSSTIHSSGLLLQDIQIILKILRSDYNQCDSDIRGVRKYRPSLLIEVA